MSILKKVWINQDYKGEEYVNKNTKKFKKKQEKDKNKIIRTGKRTPTRTPLNHSRELIHNIILTNLKKLMISLRMLE